MTRRPECKSSTQAAPSDHTVLTRLYAAVKAKRSLIHGKLHEGDKTCAMGAYFDEYGGSVGSELLEEVAAVNDAVPTALPSERRRHVLRWLEWKLGL